ncbi:putative reverse transcriptase domain-containing protein [Tanacetum coccineum]
MSPKRTTRLNPETTPAATAATTTTVTNDQLQAMIDQGVTAVLAARDANTNDVDSHNSGTGTEGVVELTQWIEKMETVFRISNCSVENQIKFSTCTLLGNALNRLTEINKLEVELWELKVKGTEVIGYTPNVFRNWQLLYVASKPKTMQEATEMAIEVMDKRIRTFADRQTENKRKQDNNQQPQQQHQNKRQNTGRAYAAGTVEKNNRGSKPLCSKWTNPDSNVVMGTFLLNNRYASVLFDTGADRSFVSTAFSTQIDITPTALDRYYDVELADERIIGNVRIPWGNETINCSRDGSKPGYTRALVLHTYPPYTKIQEYMLKGCPVFLVNVNTKETEDKSEKKRLEDVPIVRDKPDVFPEDLPGLLPTRQVEFQIDLILGAAPVARAPIDSAPSERKSCTEQLKELSDKGFIRPNSSP